MALSLQTLIPILLDKTSVEVAAIQQGAENGAPKYMEWYCGFGLLITLLWLYVEILRLLMKLNSSRD